MAWATSRSIEGLLSRLSKNDESLTSMHIFQGKDFGPKEAASLAKALESNTHLTELYASGHDIDDASIQLIGKALSKNTAVRVLCIGSSRFGDSGIRSLLEAMSGNTTLQQLDLEGKGISHAGCAAMSDALANGLAIETLLIARNPLGNEGIANLSGGLAASKLQSLDLRECIVTANGATSLAQAIPNSQTLRDVRLDSNNLQAEGALAIAEALQHSQLDELHLNSTNIGDTGLTAIARATTSSKLRILEVNDCNIGPQGAAELARVLSEGSSLTTLSIRGNHIGDEGVASLGQGLAQNKTLEDLNIGINKITSGGARILQGSTHLRKLNMEGAELGDEGCQQLANALASHIHTNLIQLELSGCSIGAAGLRRLFEVLQGFAAPALEVLLLAGNPGAAEAEFTTQVDLLSTTRTDLDVVWRGNCDAPPMAADGGPPKPLGEPEWAIDPNQLESTLQKRT